MDAITHFTQSSLKKNAPELRSGDTVRVHQRIREGNKERIQVFEGVVMSVRGGTGINASFVVRRIASGVGVEKTFPLHSPNVVKVERLKSSKVRQARLFYLRERFGRAARMSGEVRNQTNWEELKEVPATETETVASDEADLENETETPAETEEVTVEAPSEEQTSQESPAEVPEEPTDTPAS